MRDRRVMDQWISGRDEGDRVLTELTDALAEATREPRAVLMAAAGALNRLRPGIWVASLMTKDPSVMRVITVDDGDPDTARYVQAFEHSGHLSDSPISSRVIETGEPLLIPSISIVELADRYLDEGARGYMQANPWPASDSRRAPSKCRRTRSPASARCSSTRPYRTWSEHRASTRS